VCLFFVLSGYILTLRFYADGDPLVFQAAAVRRYVRLVLPVFVSVMFAWVLLVTGAYSNHSAASLGAAGWIINVTSDSVTFVGAVFRGLIGAPFFSRNDIHAAVVVDRA